MFGDVYVRHMPPKGLKSAAHIRKECDRRVQSKNGEKKIKEI